MNKKLLLTSDQYSALFDLQLTCAFQAKRLEHIEALLCAIDGYIRHDAISQKKEPEYALLNQLDAIKEITQEAFKSSQDNIYNLEFLMSQAKEVSKSASQTGDTE